MEIRFNPAASRRATFVSQLAEAITATDRTIDRFRFRSASDDKTGSLAVFGVGERDEALDNIAEWIGTSLLEYLLIIDPYFSSTDLDILKLVPHGIPIRVLADLAHQKTDNYGDRAPLIRSFNFAWRQIVDYEPPDAEIVLLGTPKRHSPLHGRHFLTSGGGISIDASLNAVGRKPTTIRRLGAEEATAVLAVHLGVLSSPIPMHNGERLQIVQFRLGETT